MHRVVEQDNTLDWSELGKAALLDTGANFVASFGGGDVVGQEFESFRAEAKVEVRLLCFVFLVCPKSYSVWLCVW